MCLLRVPGAKNAIAIQCDGVVEPESRMIECPDCEFYGPNCPGPDDERCPNREYVNEDCVWAEYNENNPKCSTYSEEVLYRPPVANTTYNRDAMIIYMFFVERKTQSNIAKTLEVSQQYVSRLTIRARKDLAKALENTPK